LYNNFYLKYNYNFDNSLAFNLRKKKLRIHTVFISLNALPYFFEGSNIKYWYYYFGITGIKRNVTFFEKMFFEKKLRVFFASSFGAIEGIWGLPKIYLKSYRHYILKKRKKFCTLQERIKLNNVSTLYLYYNYLNNLTFNTDLWIKNYYIYFNYIYDWNFKYYNILINDYFQDFDWKENCEIPNFLKKKLKKK